MLLLCLFKFVISLRKNPLYNFDNFPNMLSLFSSCVYHDSIFFCFTSRIFFLKMFSHCFFLLMFFSEWKHGCLHCLQFLWFFIFAMNLHSQHFSLHVVVFNWLCAFWPPFFLFLVMVVVTLVQVCGKFLTITTFFVMILK